MSATVFASASTTPDVPDSWETCDPETVVIPKANAKPNANAKTEEQFVRTFDKCVQEAEVTWHEPIRTEAPKPLSVHIHVVKAEPVKETAGRICKHGFFPHDEPDCQACEDEAEEAFDRRLEEAEAAEYDE